MKNRNQVLLIIGCIISAFLCGYLPAIFDISVPLTGSDLFGIDPDRNPRAFQLEDFFCFAIHISMGIGLITWAIVKFRQIKTGKLVECKFTIFLFVSMASFVGYGFLALLISPDIPEIQKVVMRYWLKASAIWLSLCIIREIIRNIVSKKPDG